MKTTQTITERESSSICVERRSIREIISPSADPCRFRVFLDMHRNTSHVIGIEAMRVQTRVAFRIADIMLVDICQSVDNAIASYSSKKKIKYLKANRLSTNSIIQQTERSSAKCCRSICFSAFVNFNRAISGKWPSCCKQPRT